MPRGTKRNNRGGYREPSKPAAVSGPGALSQRTDRGQPIRAQANDGTYGSRQASVQQQQSAPLRAGGADTPPVALTDPTQAEPVPSPIDPFGPTNRPYEPVTSGAQLGAGPQGPPGSETAADVLRAVLQTRPWAADAILPLLEQLDRGTLG